MTTQVVIDGEYVFHAVLNGSDLGGLWCMLAEVTAGCDVIDEDTPVVRVIADARGLVEESWPDPGNASRMVLERRLQTACPHPLIGDGCLCCGHPSPLLNGIYDEYVLTTDYSPI